MPFNGSGSFSTVYNWQTDAANGLNISSSRMQGQDADFAAGLSICMTKDGQQQAAANLPMGGFTLTNIANAAAQKQPISVQDFQNGTPTWLGVVSGTDTITGATNIAPGAYAAGQRFRGVTAGANATSAVTLNVNGLGAISVRKGGISQLAPGDLASGQTFDVTYDGTNFQLGGGAGGRGGLLNVQVITASGTYTPTAGADSAIVDGIGSGGASGAVASTTSGATAGAGAGSSGARGRIRIPPGSLTSQTVTIGAAGVGGVGQGGAGQTCSFGSLMVLPGGPGGYPGTAQTAALIVTQIPAPSAAPSGSGQFLFSAVGESGGPGFSGAGCVTGGSPGNSMFGPGGYGSGGYGGAIGPSQTGGNGLNGFTGAFIVYEYE